MTDEESDDGGRGVVVPDRIYRVVTVFSTLIAIVAAIVGFALLDEATGWATRPLSEVDVPLALLGLVVLAGGAIQYAYGTRFRAAGMVTDKAGEDEPDDDG